MRPWPLLLLLAACATPGPGPLASIQLDSARDLLPLQAEQASLPELGRGKVVVVDLWATWCTACHDGFGRLGRLAASQGERGLVVVGIDLGEAPEKVAAFAAANGLSYPLYLDPELVLSERWASQSLPALFVFDRDGQLVARSEILGQAELDLIRRLLEGA